jgi:hypothetical protein
MKLPNGHLAIIDPRKLTEYCLSVRSDSGKHKAIVFKAVFDISIERNMDVLIGWLRAAAADGDAVYLRSDQWGVFYRVDSLVTRLNRTATLRSIWAVDIGKDAPRLISCYIL